MNRNIIYPVLSAAFLAGASAIAHPHEEGPAGGHDHSSDQVHENGIGADPDRDTNPATTTGAISLVGDAAKAADDPPYAVVTFETPPGAHGDEISTAYKDEFGVTFAAGLTRQICEGQRHFQYDSMCTYEAAPSGRFSAGYLDYLNKPLVIEFAKPICVVAMAIYPTGGKEGEPFELTINGWTAAGVKLAPAKVDFEWTKDTIRWRHMAGAYYLGERASKISIGMRSKDGAEARKILRFLIDDVAFVDDRCEEALKDFTEPSSDGDDAQAP